ncbi:MAG TPA: hypothetical protein VIG46_05285 [Candidatus Baltobacteraceae bacterium]|jgi:hypothetical protein
MKLLGLLAAATMTGLAFAPANASAGYILTIENPTTSTYTVDVHDQSRVHGATLSAGKSVTWTLAGQTPRVTVSTAGCTASATPSIKTYVTLAIKPGCRIETKAAGVSGF